MAAGSGGARIVGPRMIGRRSVLKSVVGSVIGVTLAGRLVADEVPASGEYGPVTPDDYDFTAPEGWGVQTNPDHLLMVNPQSGCQIRILEPQATSGSLAQDASGVFELMYRGWQYRKTGEQQYVLSTGVLPRGLEYFMLEASMGKLSEDGTRYDGFEDGAALIVKAGAQAVIIAVRHNTTMSGHDDCEGKYATWRRFFNSFTVRNAPTVKAAEERDLARRIVGRWAIDESLGVSEIVFAADGTYSSDGVFAGSAPTNIQLVSGANAYSLAGDQLILGTSGGVTEQARFRFEQVNHGGSGWRDRLYLLKRDAQGETEVRYERR